MSQGLAHSICPDAEDGHEFVRRRSIGVLRRNSVAGCQVCSFLWRALLSFQDPWLKKYGDSIQFNRALSDIHSLTIEIYLDEAPTSWTSISVEFVYENIDPK